MPEENTPEPRTAKDGAILSDTHKKQDTNERRKELKEYVSQYGFYGLPVTAFSNKWKCSIQTIYKDIKQIIKEIDVPTIEEESKRLIGAYHLSIKKAYELINSSDPKDMASGINLLNSTTEKYTKFMEDYGFKERIAEKFQIEQTDNMRKDSEERLNKFLKLKDLPKEQQDLIREVMLGESSIDTNIDTTSIQ